LTDLPIVLDHDRAVGWDYTNQGCEESSSGTDGTVVICPYLFENDWMRALDLEPVPGSHEILVTQGQIQFVREIDIVSPQSNGIGVAYRAFRTWVNANHPDDIATMFGSGDQILRNPGSIPLYEQCTDEFVAASTSSTSP